MSEPAPSKYTNIRDSLVALREFIVVLAMLSLLLVPDRVRGILEDAGIRSLAGVEFDTTTLAESEASLEKADRHITQLKYELAFVHQDLKNLQPKAGAASKDINGILEHLAVAQRETIETETNLNRSIEKNMGLLKRHRRAAKPEQPPPLRQAQVTVDDEF